LASVENGLRRACPWHRDLVLFGEGDQRGAAGQIPFAPRRDHLDVGVQRIGRQFEPDLVVALAGRAMGDGIGAGFARSRSGAWRSAGRAIEVPSR
jgi:hypothetical protein